MQTRLSSADDGLAGQKYSGGRPQKAGIILPSPWSLVYKSDFTVYSLFLIQRFIAVAFLEFGLDYDQDTACRISAVSNYQKTGYLFLFNFLRFPMSQVAACRSSPPTPRRRSLITPSLASWISQCQPMSHETQLAVVVNRLASLCKVRFADLSKPPSSRC